ncbi:MAG: hypothetical protein ABI742_11550 [Gemmatimonadota bacterium]
MTRKHGGRLAGIAALALAAGACGYDGSNYSTAPDSTYLAAARADAQTFIASGNLAQALADFRHALGDSVNRAAGEQAAGRREVNWDGVSGAVLNVDTFPADFFNRVVPRGQVYATEGTGFRVSDNALADLNPAYATQFAAFSPTKIFIPVGSKAMTVNFFVAGSTTPARVNGFGVVFSDVDGERSTTLAFYDSRGRLLRQISVPVRTDAAGFSFVGVSFSSPVIAKVRIVSGQAAITGLNTDISIDGTTDLVAMDDFISGEPHAIR